jgi:flagellar biosynthetic protein FliQ
MDAQYFLTLANQSMWVLALAAAPILVPVLVSGLVIGMIQAATSINEQTLSFVPKLIVVAVSILIFGGLIVGLLSDFMVSMFERIPDLVK